MSKTRYKQVPTGAPASAAAGGLVLEYDEHEAMDLMDWGCECMKWGVQFIGAFILYFVAQHSVVSSLDMFSQGFWYGGVFVFLRFYSNQFLFDSWFITWRALVSVFKKPMNMLRTFNIVIKMITELSILLSASIVSSIVIHWHTQDYAFIGNITPKPWVTMWQAVFYEAFFRGILTGVFSETDAMTKKYGQTTTLGVGAVMDGFAVQLVYWGTATSSGGSVDVMRAVGQSIMSGEWTGAVNAFYGQAIGQVVVGVLSLVRGRVSVMMEENRHKRAALANGTNR